MHISQLKTLVVFLILFSPCIYLLSADSESKAAAASEDADYALGLKYFLGDGVLINQKRAYSLFRKAADRGHDLAKTFVGLKYAHGDGVPRDINEATRWYKSARPALDRLAEAGDPIAQTQYGRMFELGLGVKKYDTEARKWYRKAADQGYAYGQFRLGSYYWRRNFRRKDYRESNRWTRKAAEQGYARAQSSLGMSYEFGMGLPKNKEKAAEWYRKAADQGLHSAQLSLGFCYKFGNGVPQNISTALMWTRKAADQGYAGGQYHLGKYYAKGVGVPKDLEKAVEWYRKAADQGDRDAQHSLAECYVRGEGVPKDLKKALMWAGKSAEQGFRPAASLVKTIESKWDSKFSALSTSNLLATNPIPMTTKEQSDLFYALNSRKRKVNSSVRSLEVRYENFLLNAADPAEFKKVGIPKEIKSTSQTLYDNIQNTKAVARKLDIKISQLRKLMVPDDVKKTK